MPMVPLELRAGVVSQAAPFQNEGGWSQSNLIRFKDGFVQQLGGCQRLTNTSVPGTTRGMHAWGDLSNNAYVGMGTNYRLMLWYLGNIYDITPQAAVANLTNALSTTVGTTSVKITDGSNTPNVGDYVDIATMCTIGNSGVVLQGWYQVISVGSGFYNINSGQVAATTVNNAGTTLNFATTNASSTVTVTLGSITFTNYEVILVTVSTTVATVVIQGSYQLSVSGGIATFTAGSTASGVANANENGGAVRVLYGPHAAPDPNNLGYGTGNYSQGVYGYSYTGYNTLRQWSLDNWGQNLVASYTGGPPYVWAPPIGNSIYNNPAALISPTSYTGNYVPWTSNGLFVSMPQRQLIIFGTDVTLVASSGSAVQDPLLIRFSDISDYTSWYPTTTNQAGSYRIPSGSKIVGAMQGPLQSLIWTDIEFWTMQYLQFPLVYGFTKLGIGCGLISLRGAAKIGPVVIWMSQQGFFLYDGSSVRPLRCAVWDFIFDNLDTNYLDNVFAGVNSYFNEVFFFFPTIGSNGAITSYVKYNTLDNVWDYGLNSLIRTDWIDQSVVGPPVAIDQNGILQQHEVGTDLDSHAMDSWILSGWMSINPQDEGLNFVSLQRFLPELILATGTTVLFTVEVVAYQGDTPNIYGPYSVTSATEYVIVKARGRLLRVKIESSGHNTFWRLGKTTMLITAAGRR